MIKTPRQKTFWAIFLLPFAATASTEFFPWWVSAPFAFLCFVFWVGAICVLAKLPPKEKNENTGY